jgi:hypothetical protein
MFVSLAGPSRKSSPFGIAFFAATLIQRVVDLELPLHSYGDGDGLVDPLPRVPAYADLPKGHNPYIQS